MVYNENLDIHVVEEVDLYEPRISKIKTRHFCYPIALLFIIEDAFHLYLTHINYYGREGWYQCVEEFQMDCDDL